MYYDFGEMPIKSDIWNLDEKFIFEKLEENYI